MSNPYVKTFLLHCIMNDNWRKLHWSCVLFKNKKNQTSSKRWLLISLRSQDHSLEVQKHIGLKTLLKHQKDDKKITATMCRVYWEYGDNE